MSEYAEGDFSYLKRFDVAGESIYFDGATFSFTTGAPPAVAAATKIQGLKERVLRRAVVNIANACNLSCEYCFAGQGAYGRTKKLMSREAAESVISSLNAFDGIGVLTFFGGEPLLNLDVLRLMTRELRAKVSRFAVITNGSILDERRLAVLSENAFAVTVSFDGPREVQDVQRGLFDKTLNNIKQLMERESIRLKISCQVSDRHIKAGYSVPSLRRYFDARFPGVPVLFSRVACINLGSEYDNYCNDAPGEHEVEETFRALLGEDEATASKSITSILAKLLFKQRNDHFCDKCNPEDTLNYDVDGITSPCHILFGKPSQTIAAEYPFLKPKSEVQPCSSCWARNLCKVCPGDRAAQLPVSVESCPQAELIHAVLVRLLGIKLSEPQIYPSFLKNFRKTFADLHAV